jgi:putative ABC transport system permease protein
MWLEIVKMAFESLLANKTRSFLSMLGIIIGVSTVIAVFAIGQGARDAVTKQYEGLSANSILIMSNMGRGDMGRGAAASSKLKASDAQVILDNTTHVKTAVGSMQGKATVSYNSDSSSLTVIGSTAGYFDASSLKLASGRFFTDQETTDNAKVAVLGSGVLSTFSMDSASIVGQTVTIAGKPFDVIGVLQEKGTSMGPFRVDDSIIIPDTTAEKSVLGTQGMVMLNTQIDSVDNVGIATSEISVALRTEHKLKDTQEDDFNMMDAGSMVSSAEASASLMSTVLTLIAAITLLVSGIGIMNVMFVTVAERTKEIGIAKAIGGKKGDILSQFLLESIILSAIGGLIGILIGQIAIPVISYFNLMAMSVSASGPILGFSFSAIVGVTFGFYPAFKASRLDPVDALRSE